MRVTFSGTVATGLLLLGAASYAVPRAGSGGDFATFYYAALAFRRGLNPYDLGVLTGLADGMELSPFLYPPPALALFLPFTWLPLGNAVLVWFWLKAALAVVLVLLWWRVFLSRKSLLSLVAVTLFGFNAATLMDLTTGNISIVEELLLWLAFRRYVEDRRWSFALLIVLAAMFKLSPIAFLALLLVPSKRNGRSLGPALAGLGLLGAVLLVLPGPAIRWAQGLLTSTSVHRPAGEINPCALGVFDTFLLYRGQPRDGGASSLALALWAFYCMALLLVSRRALRRTWEKREPLEWVVVGSMLYALLSPRMMIYSWILPVVPAFLLVHAVYSRRRDQTAVITVLILQGFLLRAVLRADFMQNVVRLPFLVDVALANLPFLLALGLWLTFLAAPRQVGAAGQVARPGGQRDA